MHDYKGEKTFASNFFNPNLYKRKRCTKKNALKTRAVRLTCLFSILIKVRAEGKREIIKCTNFVKNAEISRRTVYFVFKMQNKT